MLEKIEQLRAQALQELKDIKDSKAYQEFNEKYFGKKGEISSIMRDLKNMAEDVRPKVGALVNAVKREVEETLGSKMQEWGEGMAKDSKGDTWIDPTVSIDRYKLGHLHPMTQLIRDVSQQFKSMGFMVLDGPELESEYYNFEALNIPSWHPSRETQDTFYVEGGGKQQWLMRTQTSDVQIRAMQKYGAPIRCVVPGRVFRNESTDASHEHTFYQIECLMVDENISIANLIASLKELISGIYNREMNIRLRPGYFPFVEPGFELDLSCTFCDAKGCPVCKHTGWIEMGGSGMVHPNVLEYGGIDSKKYSGFAFGMGLTRLLMLKYGISDIRLMQSGDLRFLKQF